MSYDGFRKEGFRIVAAFDNDPHIVGTEMNGLTIRDFSELEPFLEEQKIDVGVICVPADNAQMVADLLVNNGIQALWNFAPVDLHHPDTVKSTNVHLSDSLHILTYLMNEDALFEKKKNHSLT